MSKHLVKMVKEWTCDECGKVLVGFHNHLLYHKESAHEGLLHRCKICDAPIRSRANMTDHIRRMHGNEEFSCDQCSFKTKTKRRLKVHIGIKHAEKKFECKLCELKFGFQFGLTRHIKIVHANTLPENVKEIVSCTFCDFKSKSWNVKRHLKVHRKNESFNQQQRSSKEDTKYKYKCRYCTKSNTKQESLDYHLFHYHRNVIKPEDFKKRHFWSCPDCHFTTVRINPSHLNRHVSQKHKKQIGKVILQDIFENQIELKTKNKNSINGTTGEYFEPMSKEENVTEASNLKLELDFSLDISDEDSNDEDIMKASKQNHSYLCPIKSCTFVMSFYDEPSNNKHIETQHGDINMTGVSFIKL